MSFTSASRRFSNAFGPEQGGLTSNKGHLSPDGRFASSSPVKVVGSVYRPYHSLTPWAERISTPTCSCVSSKCSAKSRWPLRSNAITDGSTTYTRTPRRLPAQRRRHSPYARAIWTSEIQARNARLGPAAKSCTWIISYSSRLSKSSALSKSLPTTRGVLRSPQSLATIPLTQRFFLRSNLATNPLSPIHVCFVVESLSPYFSPISTPGVASESVSPQLIATA